MVVARIQILVVKGWRSHFMAAVKGEFHAQLLKTPIVPVTWRPPRPSQSWQLGHLLFWSAMPVLYDVTSRPARASLVLVCYASLI